MNDFNAQLVIQQLGFSQNRLKVMIGAKNFIQSEKWVSFKFMRGAANKATMIKIELDEVKDLYNVTFLKMGYQKLGGIRIPEAKVVSRHEGIYDDMLTPLFIAETKLDLSL